MSQNLFICNYRAYFPIDNDDGSNGYIQTNNFLLWGGSKTLMGYNKHFINNTFVFSDYAPSFGLTAQEFLGEQRRNLGNGYNVCAVSIASYPWGEAGVSGHQEQWYNNTCVTSSSSNFFNWYECNATHPLNGEIPYPLKSNRYMSTNADYEMNCKDVKWSLEEAQALGIDIDSTVEMLPTVLQLVAMGHDVLQF